MATGFFRWSKTPASNANATYTWAEGQAPSSVNDSARGIMSDVAQWRDDIGGLLTTATSATAYTLTSNSAYDSLTNLHGQLIAFTPHATNANTVGNDVTLALDGLTAKPIRAQPGVPLASGTLILGTPYIVVYNNTDGAFYLHNMTNPYQIPIAAGMDYWGPTAPNSSFAFPIGQAISRTTYASLFSGNPWSIGTTYGAGDGSTTFNLPDKTGRVSAMKEATGTRLTTAVGGVDGGTLGSAAGTQSHTLTRAQIPTGITSAGTNSISVLSNNYLLGNTTTNSGSAPGGGTQLTAADPGSGAVIGRQTSVADNSISVTSNNTSGQAHPNVQPTIICNYIMRVI